MISMCASIWTISRIGIRKHQSLSLHIAESQETRWLFGVSLLITTTLLGIGLFAWLLPYYHADWLSYTIFSFIIACLGVIAVVPHIVGSWRERVHLSVAWSMAYSLLAAMVVMLFWPLSTLARLICVSFLIIAVVMVLLTMASKTIRKRFLYFQVSYLAIFFSFLLVVTYL